MATKSSFGSPLITSYSCVQETLILLLVPKLGLEAKDKLETGDTHRHTHYNHHRLLEVL